MVGWLYVYLVYVISRYQGSSIICFILEQIRLVCFDSFCQTNMLICFFFKFWLQNVDKSPPKFSYDCLRIKEKQK